MISKRDAYNEIIDRIMENNGNGNKYITNDYWHISVSAKHETDEHGFVYL